MAVRHIFTTDMIDVLHSGHGAHVNFLRGDIKIDPKEDLHLQELLKTAIFCNNAHISSTDGRYLKIYEMHSLTL